DPPPVDCTDAEECFGRAKRAYELGVKLSEQSGADPATVYKAARQFQMASIALKGQNYRLPELQPRYEAARKRVITAFEDARVRQYLTLAEQHPIKDQDAAFRLAVLISVRSGQYDDAVLRCRRQLEQKEDLHVRLLLASIFEATGRWPEAEIERKLVLAAWPD